MAMRILCTLLLVIALNTAFAQGVDVSGIVLDSMGRPVKGVNIVLKGTSNGTVSDMDGRFRISVPAGKVGLHFAFIGYKSYEQEMTVRQSCSYDLGIVMMEDTKKRKLKSNGKIVRTDCPTTN